MELLNSAFRRMLAKESNKWNRKGPWRLPDIAYTLEHKLAFLEREHYLTGQYSLRGFFHDWEKPFMCLFPWLNEDEIQVIHRRRQPHHMDSPHQTKVKHLLEAYIDWECAAITKPDKPLDAYATLIHFYPAYIATMLPVCLAINPMSVTPTVADLDEPRKETFKGYVFKDRAVSSAYYKRALEVIDEIILNLPLEEEVASFNVRKYPGNLEVINAAEVFMKTLLILGKSRKQKLRYQEIEDYLLKLRDAFAAQTDFSIQAHPNPMNHDAVLMMKNPFFAA